MAWQYQKGRHQKQSKQQTVNPFGANSFTLSTETKYQADDLLFHFQPQAPTDYVASIIETNVFEPELSLQSADFPHAPPVTLSDAIHAGQPRFGQDQDSSQPRNGQDLDSSDQWQSLSLGLQPNVLPEQGEGFSPKPQIQSGTALQSGNFLQLGTVLQMMREEQNAKDHRSELTRWVENNDLPTIMKFLHENQVIPLEGNQDSSQFNQKAIHALETHDKLCYRPVDLAAELGFVEVFKVLVKAHPTINPLNTQTALTILDYALNPNTFKPKKELKNEKEAQKDKETEHNGKIAIGLFLLQSFPQIIKPSKGLLCNAVKLGSLELVSALLAVGVNVDGFTVQQMELMSQGKGFRNSQLNETPLETIFEIALKVEDKVKALMKELKGIQEAYDTASKEGKLASEEASQSANAKMAEVRLLAQKNLQEREKELDVVKKIIVLLIQHKANIHLGKVPPLFRAVLHNSVFFVQLLLAGNTLPQKADPNSSASYYVKELLANVNCPPLCVALYQGSLESANILIAAGANRYGMVPVELANEKIPFFHFAIMSGSKQNVRWYLEQCGFSGSDLISEFRLAMSTAIKQAQSSQNVEVIELLLKAGFNFRNPVAAPKTNDSFDQKMYQLYQVQQLLQALGPCFDAKYFEEVLAKIQQAVEDLKRQHPGNPINENEVAIRLLNDNLPKILKAIYENHQQQVSDSLKKLNIGKIGDHIVNDQFVGNLYLEIFKLRFELFVQAKKCAVHPEIKAILEKRQKERELDKEFVGMMANFSFAEGERTSVKESKIQENGALTLCQGQSQPNASALPSVMMTQYTQFSGTQFSGSFSAGNASSSSGMRSHHPSRHPHPKPQKGRLGKGFGT